MKSHQIKNSKFQRLVSKNPFNNKAVSPLCFYGVLTTKPCFLYESHFEALVRVLKFHFKRKKRTGSFALNIFFRDFLTKKAIGVRMGKGKGAKEKRVCYMRPGTIFLVLNDPMRVRAHYVAMKCARRMPTLCKVVSFSDW